MLVLSPAMGGRVALGERLTGELGVAADTVTGASADVVTAASSRAIREQREQVTLGLVARLPRYIGLTARVIGSHEHDYDVVHGWLLASAELAQRNTVVELGVDLGHAWVRSATDPSFDARRRDDRAVLRVSQVVDPRTYLDLLVDASRLAGYQASPYRMVTIVDAEGPGVMRISEATPTRRRTLAAALRMRHALGTRWFVFAGYRAVADSWAMTSHTVDAMAIVTFDGARQRIGLSARGYVQSAAEFFRASYTAPDGVLPALRTRDRSLGTMRTASAELFGARELGHGLRLEGSLGCTWFRWPDDPIQRRRTAITSTTAFSTSW